MVAVNHDRACNVAQPLMPGIDLLPGGFAIVAAAQ